MTDRIMSELWLAIMEWCASTGAQAVNEIDGLWSGTTEENDTFPATKVEVNGHDHDVDGLPSFNIRLTVPDYFPEVIGIFGPRGGVLLASRHPGEDENGLIRHFRAQTLKEPANVE